MSYAEDRGISIPQDLDPGAKYAVVVMLAALCVLVLFLLVWATVSKMDIAVHGRGQVIPTGRLQQVQSLEGGILREVLTKEGQQVKAGEVLVRIDSQQYDAALSESRQTYWGMQATVSRLEAELSGVAPVFSPEIIKNAPTQADWEMRTWRLRVRELQASLAAINQLSRQRESDADGSRTKLEAAKRNLELAKESLGIEARLFEKGAGSKGDLLTAQQRVATLEGDMNVIRSIEPGSRAAVSEVRARMAEIESKFRAEANTQRNDLQTRSAALRERMVGESDKVKRTELRATMDGVVNRVLVMTVGGVLKPGETVLELVPQHQGALFSTRVRTEDIGFITVGQNAMVRLSAYDAAVFGALNGTVRRVGADALLDEKKESYFDVQIETSEQLKDKEGNPLIVVAGMTADVAIRTGERTVMQYMLKPIVKVLQTSLKER